MSVSTEDNNKTSESSILKELDDLMGFISDDTDAGKQEDLIDPSFFIGQFEENPEDRVPTLTSVAEELAREEPAAPVRQPGLFSNRVEEIKREQEEAARTAPKDTTKEINLDKLVDALVAEYLPKIETELREKLRVLLESKK